MADAPLNRDAPTDVPETFGSREVWKSRCLACMVQRRPSMDVDEAMQLVAVASVIGRLRRMKPELAAEELLSGSMP